MRKCQIKVIQLAQGKCALCKYRLEEYKLMSKDKRGFC